MKSFAASMTMAVLAGLVNAVKFTNTDFTVAADESFTLTWTDGTGPYQVLLKSGPSTNLVTVETLVASTTAESATVTLSSSLTSGAYAFEIVDTADDSTNYSLQFPFVGSAASSSAVSTASSTKATASSTLSTSVTVTSSTATTTSTETSTDSSSTATTTGTSSTKASTTTSSTSTKTSSSATATTTVPSSDARGLVAPFLAPLILAVGVAAF